GSTSANTGVAPSYSAQFADATNEYGEVITSSPGPIPAVTVSRCRPAVPLETAAAYGAPTISANASSKRSIVGPSDNRPERSTSATSSSSGSSSQGFESGTCRVIELIAGPSRIVRSRGSVDDVDDVEPVVPALVDAVHSGEVCLLQLQSERADA